MFEDELIVTLNRSLGMTIIVVTHELDSILNIGTRCVLLDRVKRGIIADGSPRDLVNSSDERVRAFFQRGGTRANGGSMHGGPHGGHGYE